MWKNSRKIFDRNNPIRYSTNCCANKEVNVEHRARVLKKKPEGRPRIAVVTVTHDEVELRRAIRSLLRQKRECARLYLVDAGTKKAKAKEVLEYVVERMLKPSGLDFQLIRMEHVGAAVARARVYHQIRADADVDLVTCLDADDELGLGAIKALRTAYVASKGKVDVIVPREIQQIFDSGISNAVKALTIPKTSFPKDSLSKKDLRAWARLTSVGATFGIRVGALAQYNGFGRDHRDDEWVWMLCQWAARGARFVPAEVTAKHSYQHHKHDIPGANHAPRRRLHGDTRDRTAKAAFEKVATARRSELPPEQP